MLAQLAKVSNNRLFRQYPALGLNFNHQNTFSIPAVKIFSGFDLGEKSKFSFGAILMLRTSDKKYYVNF